jgi:hypothetical protein
MRELLIRNSSRAQTDFIASIVHKKPEVIDELWQIYLLAEEPVSRKAAWAIDIATEQRNDLVEPWLERLIAKLPQFNHDGLKRHGMRMIARCRIPEESVGLMINQAFEWLLNPTESVAVKMYCIETLYNISINEPDIQQELYDTIEFQMGDGTPGFKSVANKYLKKIDKNLLNSRLR